MTLSIHFLGAARTVTGSKFLLETGDQQVLVDCGLFQGRKQLRERNWTSPPIPAGEIDAVVLTHAHIDHCGYLPRLIREGFDGPVYASRATRELLELMLPDSGHLQEEEARYANKKGYSKHKPALPLYTKEEGIHAVKRVKTVDYHTERKLFDDLHVTLHPAGHILGSAFVEMRTQGRRIVFSGDVGGYDRTVMSPPSPLPADVDYLLVESTYGARNQDNEPVQDQIRERVRPVLENGGVVVIPAFAVGRTTLILYHLRQLMDRDAIPDVPVFVDSPMATDAVEIYCRHGNEHNLKIDLLRDSSACPIRTPQIHLIRSVPESKELNTRKGPAIIVSASGMATGGRVLHHLKKRLPHRENLILLVGYQAYGTRGRRLMDGEEEIKIFGKMVPVNAKVMSIRGLSAHGDSDDLLRWMKTASRPPTRTFLIHGEDEALEGMARRVDEELGFPHYTPDYLEEVGLE